MKGISTILAMILIVIIVVALIGLTYTFALGLFSSTTGGVNEQTSQVTETLSKVVAIESAKCVNISGSNFNVTFTLRSKGTSGISGSEMAAFFDDSRVNPTLGDIGANSLDSERYFTVTTTAGEHTLRISSPAVPVDYKVNCAA